MATAYNLITDNLRYFSSENFLNVIKDASSYVYVFLGKSGTWDDWWTQDPSSDNYPLNVTELTLSDSIQEDINVWNEIMCMKRVLPNYCFRVIKKNKWTSGVIYDQYDDIADLNTLKFHVVTEPEGNVYKCINNNQGSVSIDKPTEKDSGVFSTDDGYIWKYMYNKVDNWDMWDIDDWFPVKNITNRDENVYQWNVMKSARAGSIENFVIDDSVYESLTNGDIVTLVGNVSQIVEQSSEPFSGEIETVNGKKRVKINNSGLGYTYVKEVRVNNVPVPKIRAVFSPEGGHGFNPVSELNGHYVMIGADIGGNSEDFFVNNEYNQVGVILNPLRTITSLGVTNKTDYISGDNFVVGERCKSNDIDCRISLPLTATDDLDIVELQEELVKEDGARIMVEQPDSQASGVLISASDTDDLQGRALQILSFQEPSNFKIDGGKLAVSWGNEFLVSDISLDSGRAIRPSDIIKYSGDLLYVENRAEPESRTAEDQSDNLRMVLEF